MVENGSAYTRSGGRRISLYGVLGRYFSPDGHLDENALRAFINESLKEHGRETGGKWSSAAAGKWLSAHLDEVLGYLEDKGMIQDLFRLFEIVAEESAKAGIETISIAPARLKRIIAASATADAGGQEKRTSGDEKREKIFSAALKIFSEQGFHETTIDEIAALSGVGKGTVYRNFKSKEELLDQLLREKSRPIVSQLIRLFSKDGDVLILIKEFIAIWVDFIKKNEALYRLFQTEGLGRHAGRKMIFFDYLVANLPMIKERIVSVNFEGKLKTMNFYTVLYGTLGFVDGVVQKWVSAGKDYPLEEDIPIIMEVLFNGFVDNEADREVFFVAPEAADNSPIKKIKP